jgi:hypothetical protein
MEAIGQTYGFILYRTRLDRPNSAGRGVLEIAGLRDYALIFQGEKRLGVLDRRLRQSKLDVDLDAGVPLDILVENMGRINFGQQLLDERKGITGPVTLDGAELRGWEIFPLPLDDPAADPQKAGSESDPKADRHPYQGIETIIKLFPGSGHQVAGCRRMVEMMTGSVTMFERTAKKQEHPGSQEKHTKDSVKQGPRHRRCAERSNDGPGDRCGGENQT